jgi:hypothetical protein
LEETPRVPDGSPLKEGEVIQRRKNGECEEEILPVGGKSEEAADLKKYLKCFGTYVLPPCWSNS